MKAAFVVAALILSSSTVFAYPTKQCLPGQFVINGRCATIPEAIRKTQENPLAQKQADGDYVNSQGVVVRSVKCPDAIVYSCYSESKNWESFHSCYKSCESAMTDGSESK